MPTQFRYPAMRLSRWLPRPGSEMSWMASQVAPPVRLRRWYTCVEMRPTSVHVRCTVPTVPASATRTEFVPTPPLRGAVHRVFRFLQVSPPSALETASTSHTPAMLFVGRHENATVTRPSPGPERAMARDSASARYVSCRTVLVGSPRKTPSHR